MSPSSTQPAPEFSAKTLIVEAEVRYWEDAAINGVQDSDGSLIPLRRGDFWCPVIDLDTGAIRGWPDGTSARIHYKVCDAGEYWLGDEQGRKRWKWKDHYVPDRFLCVGDEGYGDYIILKVQANGRIEGWSIPTIDTAEWAALRDLAGKEGV